MMPENLAIGDLIYPKEGFSIIKGGRQQKTALLVIDIEEHFGQVTITYLNLRNLEKIQDTVEINPKNNQLYLCEGGEAYPGGDWVRLPIIL